MNWVAPSEKETANGTLLKELLKKVSEIPATVDYDAFGRIYEYFLGEFARTEGQKGGEFYTPSCIVRLLTEVIEPYHGRILDPACGSGGMFVSSARFVSEHIQNVFAEGELSPESVIREFRITAADGKTYETQHYNLDAIISVGYRVKSQRGTQFRIWATQRLREYLVKGFTMDDERLKNPPGKGHKDYFDELLERIREIRSSERRFYQKVLEIYATSVDYDPPTEASQQFFATVGKKGSASGQPQAGRSVTSPRAGQWRGTWGGDLA